MCARGREAIERQIRKYSFKFTSQNKKKTKGALNKTKRNKRKMKNLLLLLQESLGHMKKKCPRYAAWCVKKLFKFSIPIINVD